MEPTFYNIRQIGMIGIRYATERADEVGKYDVRIPIGLVIGLLFAIAAVAYLIGSINTAVLLSCGRYHADIRESGSGNAGTTNMMRTYGKGAAGITLLGDVLKGVIAYFIGATLLGETGGYAAGLFCILGHAFPLYFHFKGGKGVATSAGVILCISPLTFAVLLLIFVLLVAWTKYVSLGSVMGMLLFPLLVQKLSMQRPQNGIFAVLIALLVIFLHRANIKRLFQGTENKISFHKKDKESEKAGKP